PFATATYTPSLHDALPISCHRRSGLSAGWYSSLQPPVVLRHGLAAQRFDLFLQRLVFRELALEETAGEGGLFGKTFRREDVGIADRKSTRLNSSHVKISYA